MSTKNELLLKAANDGDLKTVNKLLPKILK